MGVAESVIGWREQGEAWCAGWGLQTGGQLGGEVKSDFFSGTWGVWIWLHLLTRHITSHGYPGGNWGQSQPFCTVKTQAPGSPAERTYTQTILWKTKGKKIFISVETKNIVESKWIQKMLRGQHLHTMKWVTLQPHHLIRGGEAGKSKLQCRWWTQYCVSQRLKIQTQSAAANSSKHRESQLLNSSEFTSCQTVVH